jgi:prepilin-type N-terminal cleavage/methylation domain-containing protein
MVRTALPRPAHLSPPGFTLVEAVVALTLLAVGLLGAMATQSLAARLLREAEAHAGAVALAGAVLDSLLAVPSPTAGERRESRYRVHWSTHPHDVTTTTSAEIGLEIEYHDGTKPRRLRFDIMHTQPLPRIGGVE